METLAYHPTICITQRCNLNCIYCYQKHNEKSISYETAIKCIDDIFQKDTVNTEKVEINFIGGEPLLEFDLLKKLFYYVQNEYKKDFYFFITTNGTVLNDEMKDWIVKHKENFILGLSLDGLKNTHDYNRSNSFDKIDIDFFRNTYPRQNVKMTLTDYSLKHLADNIKFIHSKGYDFIGGVNLYEGKFNWTKNEYLYVLIPQLKELVDYYLKNPKQTNQMFKKTLANLEVQNKEIKKYCGIGIGAVFYDVDGIKRPCSYCTSMTFSPDTLNEIQKIDFTKDENFVDLDCLKNCYLYPICPHCSGANYLATSSFSKWDKSKCKIQKLISLFVADLTAQKIITNKKIFDAVTTYKTIKAIEKIRELYYQEFAEFFSVSDEIEKIKELVGLANKTSNGCWYKSRWTKNLNERFIDCFRRKGYRVYCKTKGADDKEWLYDITICKQTDENICETYLVVESEWSKYEEDIWYDFQKLLLCNSKFKLMVFSCKNLTEQNKLFADMNTQIKSYQTCNGIFILACFVNNYGYEFEVIDCNSPKT